MMYYEFEYKNKSFIFRYIDSIWSAYFKGAAFSYSEGEILNQKLKKLQFSYPLRDAEFEHNKTLLLEALLKFKKIRALL